MTKRSMRMGGVLLVLALLGGACSNSSTKSSTDTGKNGTTPGDTSTSGGTLFSQSALNQPESVGTPKVGGTLTFGLESNVLTLDPAGNMIQPADVEVGTAIYDNLVKFDDKGQPAADLADSWTNSPDLKTWTFKLHPGVTFSNGDAFDSAAVVAAIHRSQNPPQGACSCKSDADNIASVTATGPLTVQFVLKTANVAWPVKMAGSLGQIVDVKAAEAEGAGFATKPVGTGPFMMQTYGDTITVVRNPHYWKKDKQGRSLPYLDKIVFRPLPDTKTRLAAVQSGGVDIMQTADTDNLVQAKKDKNLVIQPVTGSSATILIINFKHSKVFSDIRARQALNYGLDRIDLNQRAYQGARVPAYGFYSPIDPYYDPSAQLPTYNLARAKSLLAELKKAGKPVNYSALCIPTPESTTDFSILKQQSAVAGATVTLKTMDQASFVAALLGGKANYDVACFRSPQAADPDDFYGALHTGGGTNIPGYSNPQVDKLLDEGRATTNVATRKKDYDQVQKLVSADVVFVPLLFDLYGNIHSTKVSGLSLPCAKSLGEIDTDSLYFKS